jgi:hypothetical protein
MGAIYAAASNVLAVLSPSTSFVLETLRRGQSVDSQQLRLLEADDWVSRAWTYQEIVNSKIINFVAEGQTGNCISGFKLLNAIGDTIAQCRRAEQVDAYEFRKTHPHLDALETLAADWLESEYAQRSAYRIMTAMVDRTTVYPDDYFYAMVGRSPRLNRSRTMLS